MAFDERYVNSREFLSDFEAFLTEEQRMSLASDKHGESERKRLFKELTTTESPTSTSISLGGRWFFPNYFSRYIEFLIHSRGQKDLNALKAQARFQLFSQLLVYYLHMKMYHQFTEDEE